MSFRASRWLYLLLTTALSAPVPVQAARPETFPGLNRKWVHYQSPNFELYSANRESDSRDVLEKMELLRAVFLDTFKLTVRLPQPVTIYYFKKDDDFTSYMSAPLRNSGVQWAGTYLSDVDRSVITLAPDSEFEAVYHEYVHHLFRIVEDYPALWFNEGVAELFSSMKGDSKWLTLGDPAVGRVDALKRGEMMPFEQLFAVTSASPIFRDSLQTGIFYAQSWAFLHYCQYGRNEVSPEKMALFLRIAGSPRIQEHPEQFRAATKELLGLDYPELRQELQRYISYGRFRVRKMPRPEIAPESSYAKRPVPAEEMKARLAELLLRYTQSAQAKWNVLDLLGRNADIRLYEVLGTVALRANDPDLARQHWNSAVDLGTTNTAVFRELSRLEAGLVFNRLDLDYRLPDERAARLRMLLEKSIASAPEQSAGYEMLAWVEAFVRKPRIANVNLVQQHFNSLNDKPRVLLALVLVRYHLGDAKAALKLLDELNTLDPGDWVKYGAEITRARLEQRAVDPGKLPATDSGRSKMVSPEPGLPR